MPVYSIGYIKRMLYPEQPTVLLAQGHLGKFEFHFEHSPRNTRFLSLDGPSNYLHLFKNHLQTFWSPGKRPSFQIKVTKL